MPGPSLQTVIVSKQLTKSRRKATDIARPLANRIYTSRETKTSFRFRQRPPSDFVKGSFRTFQVPDHPGVAYVYGKLKRGKRVENPAKGKKILAGKQRHFQWRGTEHGTCLAEWDYWLLVSEKVNKAKTERALRKIALDFNDREIKSSVISGLIISSIADRARELGDLRRAPSSKWDRVYVRSLIGTAKKKPKENPSKRVRNKSTKKASKKKSTRSPKAKRLSKPRKVPDPGPCAWLGSTLELSFDSNGRGDPNWAKIGEKDRIIWDCGRRTWMCLWSPKYKAIVAIPQPRSIKGGPGCKPIRGGKVVRMGGGARMFEEFAARAAECTQEVEVPALPLKKLGDGVHIVYRSDKWSEKRRTTDYIHDFKKDVQIYCGPTLEKPEVFVVFGGKLTLTKRGLVF